MARLDCPLLVDTNTIIECYRTKAWKALSGGYPIETVEYCVIETQTGFQRRRKEDQIDIDELNKSLKAIHVVTDLERAEAILRDGQIASLDKGEQDLWSHAISRNDLWILCGPDKASLRIGIRLGFTDRLVSLERLLVDAGFRSAPKNKLKEAYTETWLRKTLTELVLSERK